MREIKVRAWNASTKAWLYDEDIIIFLNGKIAVYGNKPMPQNIYPQYYSLISIVQFTGLVDKYGKEIYEGDILKNDYGDPLLEVVFENGGFIFVIPGSREGMSILRRLNPELNTVIGNIFENPELVAL